LAVGRGYNAQKPMNSDLGVPNNAATQQRHSVAVQPTIPAATPRPQRSRWLLAVPAALLIATAVIWTACSSSTKPQNVSESISGQVRSDPALGITLTSPPTWKMTPVADAATGGEILYITRPTAAGSTSPARLALSRSDNPSGTALDPWLRTLVGDTKRLLVLQPCSFRTLGQECLQLVDEQVWDDAGNLPLQANVFLRVPGYVYSAAIDHVDGDNFQQVAEQQILGTMQFTAKP
jgi:hypothetical protein